jgi:hypothetical protein
MDECSNGRKSELEGREPFDDAFDGAGELIKELIDKQIVNEVIKGAPSS